MKNKILFVAMAFIACISSQLVNAQLKVTSSGSVKAENKFSVTPTAFSDSDSAIAVVSTAAFTKSAYGIYSKAWYQKNPAGSQPIYNIGNKVIGIYGNTEDNLIPLNHASTPPFNAGLAGTSDKGVGVYGAITDTFPIYNPGQYAGFFMGNTKVVGTLTCTSLTQTSDARTKHDITYLRDNTLGSIMQLKPISFYYNTDDKLFNAADVESPAAQQMHYGFVAQELQEVLPNIVYMGQDSLLNVNYIELIPLLVKTIQDQETRIDELERAIEASAPEASGSKAPQKSNNGNIIETAVLYQNTPNPFTQDTRIAYDLPLTTHDATLYIYDANGLQLESYMIREFGANSITISGGHLPAGIYLYSLVADGLVVDTKRMILTK